MRVTRGLLEELAAEYAKSKGKRYGHGRGEICLIPTDARIAPYNYRLVEYADKGGFLTIWGAATAREMYQFLTTGG